MTQNLTEAVNAIRECILDLGVEVAEIRLTEFLIRVELRRGLREVGFVMDYKELTVIGFDIVKSRLQSSAEALRYAGVEDGGVTRDEGWVVWDGGACPLPLHTLVDIRYRSGTVMTKVWTHPNDRGWVHNGSYSDVVAYRLATSAFSPKTQ